MGGFVQQLRAATTQAIVGLARGIDPNAFPEYPTYWRNIPVPLSNFALDYPRAAAAIPIVYACIDLLATDAASLPVRFWRKDKAGKKQPIEREDGNIVDLWERCNPVQSRHEQSVEVQTSLDIGGNAYLFLETYGSDRPTKDWELWYMPPHVIKPTVTDHRQPIGYEFMGGIAPVMLDAKRVIHLRYWHPQFSPIGLSPLEAARIAYESRYMGDRFNRAFYERGGNLNHVFQTDSKAAPRDPKWIKQEQDRLEEKFGGLRNAWKPVILQGMEIARAGLTHQEMAFVENMRMTDADICRVFGIPPVIMGIKEGGGLSDAGASTDLVRYWENAQKKRARLRDAVITKHLCSRFDPSGSTYCETDFSGVPALQEQLLKQAKSLVILTGRPVMDVNEARKPLEQSFGIGPREDEDELADVLFMPASPESGKEAPGEETALDGGDESADTETQTSEPSKPKAGKNELKAARERRLVSLRRQASAMLARYERKFERAMRGFFTKQEERVLGRLEFAYQSAGIDTKRLANGQAAKANRIAGLLKRAEPAGEFDNLLDANDQVDALELERIFNDLMAERGEELLAEIGVEIEIELNRLRAQRYAQKASVQVLTQTSETTRSRLREALARVLGDGGTYADAYAAVQDVFEGRRQNAATIARTEMLGAYNHAGLDAATQSGVVDGKEWLTAEDELVRAEHKHAEESGFIALDGSWRMDSSEGAVEAQFPGDPDLPPELKCNCRCTLKYRTNVERVAKVKADYARTQRRLRMPDAMPGEVALGEWVGR